MKINKNNVTRGLNKIKLLGIKHSPTIFMVAGLAGVVENLDERFVDVDKLL